MKWFNNLSTRAKLIIGFGMIWLLLAVVIVTAYNNLTEIAQSEKEINEINFKKVLSLQDLQSGLNYNRGQVLEMTLAADRADQEVNKKNVTDRSRKMDEIIDTLLNMELVPQNQSQLKEIQSILAEYRPTRDQQSALVYQGKVDAARQLILGIQDERYEKIRLLAVQLGDRLMDDLSKRIAMDMQKTKVSIRIFLIVGAAAFLFGLLMIVLLNQVIVKPLSQIAGAATRLASGDLDITLTADKRSDEVGALAQAFNRMVENLRSTITGITESVALLSSSSSEILAATTQVASGTAENASAISETTSTVEEVRQTAQLSSQKGKNVADSAQHLEKVSKSGQNAVEETKVEMGRIREQMESIAQTVVRLSEQGQSIGGIIASVTDIADQSNLLAVNAAIEAARAGEQGKAFAVVAQEIKSLAEQSKQATTQVRSILTDVQKATSAAVMATEQGSKAVDAGVKQSAQAGEAIRVLAESSTVAVQAAMQIVASSQQQVVGMNQIGTAMENVNQAGAETAASMKQAEIAAKNLHELGQKLKGLVEQFKV
ncbi:MAG: methyl-accepting chemotaxis protein [Candidatus Aminicenantes bacterium]|nr:methyl-accepting chemotaxis protein [Candidatus Aminicenantes bacterium]